MADQINVGRYHGPNQPWKGGLLGDHGIYITNTDMIQVHLKMGQKIKWQWDFFIGDLPEGWTWCLNNGHRGRLFQNISMKQKLMLYGREAVVSYAGINEWLSQVLAVENDNIWKQNIWKLTGA